MYALLDPPKSDKEEKHIRIDPKLWKAAKKFAVDKDKHLGQLIEDALIHEMQRG